jgi:hypothetical protein
MKPVDGRRVVKLMSNEQTYHPVPGFEEAAINLHDCLKRHQIALEARGLIAELGALLYWTERVADNRLTARDALDRHGFETLLRLKYKMELALGRVPPTGREIPVDLAPASYDPNSDAYSAIAAAVEKYMLAAVRQKLVTA